MRKRGVVHAMRGVSPVLRHKILGNTSLRQLRCNPRLPTNSSSCLDFILDQEGNCENWVRRLLGQVCKYIDFFELNELF